MPFHQEQERLGVGKERLQPLSLDDRRDAAGHGQTETRSRWNGMKEGCVLLFDERQALSVVY